MLRTIHGVEKKKPELELRGKYSFFNPFYLLPLHCCYLDGSMIQSSYPMYCCFMIDLRNRQWNDRILLKETLIMIWVVEGFEKIPRRLNRLSDVCI